MSFNMLDIIKINDIKQFKDAYISQLCRMTSTYMSNWIKTIKFTKENLIHLSSWSRLSQSFRRVKQQSKLNVKVTVKCTR